jgi:cytochrome d ubiquinol oxidase subunit II
VASVLFGWGVAQWPYLIVPDVTVTDAAAPDATLRVVIIGFALGGAVLAPSLFLLFRIFKLER